MDNCPYSKNGRCTNCSGLPIKCNGEKDIHCTQYELVSGKITPEELDRRAWGYRSSGT